MPIPSPRKGESQDGFHGRCMGDDTMKRDFRDVKQRNAVCFRQWRERKRAALEIPEQEAFAVAFLDDNPRCFQSHIGPWAIEPDWFTAAVHAAQSGRFPQAPLAWRAEGEQAALDDEEDALFTSTNGVAIVRIVGQMQKGFSKFGGTSSIMTRRALRQARADDGIHAILLAIDSPGGMVAGTQELADEVQRTNSLKPVHAHIDDLGASAAYWVASQSTRITANRTAQIGSIGVMAILEDASGLAERAGLKVHVVSTGPFKGLGVKGTTVLPEHLSEVEAQVEALGEHFFAAVQEGRRMSRAQVQAVSDGRVWIATQAQRLGLIDAVQSFDTTLAALIKQRPRSAARAAHDSRLATVTRIP